MTGIEINRFVRLDKVLAKHLECGICLNVYFNPMDTLCRHTFCCYCIMTSIETNGKVCPECKQSLVSRKRSESSANVAVIANDVILEKNRKIHNIINDLKIKCDYDYKGCEEVLAFGLLSSHLKCCRFRQCADCGVVEDKDKRHNCVEVLKQRINELNEKIKEMTKELKTKDKTYLDLNKQLIECKKQLNVISVYNQMNESIGKELTKFDFTFTPKYVMIGTYSTSANAIEFNTNFIKISHIYRKVVKNSSKAVKHSSKAVKPYCDLGIPFLEIQELKYCLDSKLTALFIKPDVYSCTKTQQSLHLGHKSSTNRLRFDVHSNDIKKQFIKIVLKFGFNDKLKEDLFKAITIANHCPIESIDANSAHQLLT